MVEGRFGPASRMWPGIGTLPLLRAAPRAQSQEAVDGLVLPARVRTRYRDEASGLEASPRRDGVGSLQLLTNVLDHAASPAARITALWDLVPAFGAATWVVLRLRGAGTRAAGVVAVVAAVVTPLTENATFGTLAGLSRLPTTKDCGLSFDLTLPKECRLPAEKNGSWPRYDRSVACSLSAGVRSRMHLYGGRALRRNRGGCGTGPDAQGPRSPDSGDAQHHMGERRRRERAAPERQGLLDLW